jgi:integrase
MSARTQPNTRERTIRSVINHSYIGAELARPRQDPGDQQLIALWLHGRSPHTQRAYQRDAARLLAHVGVGLRQLTLGQLQAFAASLQQLAPSTQARVLASVKSLLSFGVKVGHLAVNVGAALRVPPRKQTLAERILSKDDVQQLLAAAAPGRDRTLLTVLYLGGLRVSEACALCWRDLRPQGSGGAVTVYGKGGKTRTVKLQAAPWQELQQLRGRGRKCVRIPAGRSALPRPGPAHRQARGGGRRPRPGGQPPLATPRPRDARAARRRRPQAGAGDFGPRQLKHDGGLPARGSRRQLRRLPGGIRKPRSTERFVQLFGAESCHSPWQVMARLCAYPSNCSGLRNQ